MHGSDRLPLVAVVGLGGLGTTSHLEQTLEVIQHNPLRNTRGVCAIARSGPSSNKFSSPKPVLSLLATWHHFAIGLPHHLVRQPARYSIAIVGFRLRL